ncbi:MAG: hypothetical protein KDK34_24890 [Leptospiraceae bacterium]|nr:hypothetical protein [Leptospiraceae bacterium]
MRSILSNPVFLLLLIIVLGELLGRLKISGFSFGSAAIIFVALIFGHFGVTIPAPFQDLGLALFIYSIGLQAGPGIRNSFSREGLQLSLGALMLVFVGLITVVLCALVFDYSADMSAGVFAGALTSTPGLAVASELGEENIVGAAYGVTYTFGVLGVILFIRLSPFIFRVDLLAEEKLLQNEIEALFPKVIYAHVRIDNPNVIGKKIREIGLSEMAAVSITRRLPAKSRHVEMVDAGTVLGKSDILRIVGTATEIKKAEVLFGKRVRRELKFEGDMLNHRIVVSRNVFVGQTISSLNLHHTFNVQVARMTRNDIDLPISAHRRLKMGDILHVVGHRQSVESLTKHLGNDFKSVYTANVLAVFIGIALGYLIGLIPFSLPGTGEFRLGTVGGVLLSGLILGNLYHTRTFVWQIPTPANTMLRQIGLSLFMAVVGTSAGATIVHTMQEYGLALFLVGILTTMIPLLIGYALCRYVLKIRFFHVLGVLTGGMTSTPGLASVNSLTDTSFASSAYATVYPVALVAMILCTKIIMFLL